MKRVLERVMERIEKGVNKNWRRQNVEKTSEEEERNG